MKRLCFFVVTIALAVQWVAVFSPIAYAQGVDRATEQQQGTYEYFFNQGINILDATISSLQLTKKTIDESKNEPNKTVISSTISKYIQIFQDEKIAYTASFNQAKGANLLPAKAQIQANPAGSAEFQKKWGALTVQEKQEPRVGGIVATYRTQWNGLLQQAQQINAGVITAGGEEANSLGNASAVSTAGTSAAGIVSKNDASKCKTLLSSSIIDCIDAGFSWLVKNTFLQVAGFLVWLAANILNYSIQISILDFAGWSPTSLYPVWIIIRQIVSLVVVFAGLYLGFMYIVGREDTFGKYIGWVIVFALFVNFSYPITRMLVDVSNIVSLNVYSSAIGGDALASEFGTDLTTSGGNTAGSLIMNRLGLTGLFVSATKVDTGSGFTARINSTPGALVAVAFALYAAYVLFMCASLMVVRAAVFAFLIVASPLLLVDAVVPKLGEVAVKMRKMFFEQLIVAPVFMIMLALTLKFMDVFQTTGGPLASPGAENIKVFFNILMMVVMLHIMFKVTKAAAGGAGEMATNFMGKVGGFGLGVATGGAGLLARGTVGAAAARLRDSGMMDRMQASRTGRGLYSLTNSLAQSTFDARNVGAVSKGMSTAGMGMGTASTKTYESAFKEKKEAIRSKYESIKDGDTRKTYLARQTGSLGSRVQGKFLAPLGLLGVEKNDERNERKSDAEKIVDKIKEEDRDKIKRYDAIKDGDRKADYLETLPENLRKEIEARKKGTVSTENKTTTNGKESEIKMQTKQEDLSVETPTQTESRLQNERGVGDVKSQSFEERAAQIRKDKVLQAQRNIDKGTGPAAPAAQTSAPKPQSPNPSSKATTA